MWPVADNLVTTEAIAVYGDNTKLQVPACMMWLIIGERSPVAAGMQATLRHAAG